MHVRNIFAEKVEKNNVRKWTIRDGAECEGALKGDHTAKEPNPSVPQFVDAGT